MSLPLTEYREYVPLTPNEKYDRFVEIKKLFDSCANAVGCRDAVCRRDVLFEVIERVEKRKVYFRVFHGLVMSERNEAALYCFWILKLAPFFDVQNPCRQINARFAVFLFLRMIGCVERRMRGCQPIPHKYVQNLYYAFLYQDISKEAIMLAADTLLA